MITKYIREHKDEDGATLLLRDATRISEFDVTLAVSTIEARAKVESKIPSWYAHEDILYPSKLSVEQCSSETTAFYKASVVSQFVGRGGRIADLTSGLGVDDWAFAQKGYSVWYNDMNHNLADVVAGNFSALGIVDQIEFNRFAVAREYSEWLEALRKFSPSAVFVDPARRSASGSKVFRLQDCSPNILDIVPQVASVCPLLFLKLSPMLDVTSAVADLAEVGASVREVHFVGSEDECKEVFLVVELEASELAQDPQGCAEKMCHPRHIRDAVSVETLGHQTNSQGPSLLGRDSRSEVFGALPVGPELAQRPDDPHFIVSNDGVEQLSFYPSEEKAAVPEYYSAAERGTGAEYLYIPSAAAMKSGAFKLMATRFGLKKAAPNTHVYFGSKQMGGFPGKIYKVDSTLPFNKRTIKEVQGIEAEVTAKNFPMSSADLVKRLKSRSSNARHLFALGLLGSSNVMFVCSHADVPLRIAVYAGSFNPFHEGHAAIVRRCSENFDKVLVVVSPENPFKKGNAASGETRLAAVRDVIEKFKEETGRRNVEVSNIEYHLNPPLYTINTLRALRHQYPTAVITFIMGADCLAQLNRWSEYKPLLLEFGIAVFPRLGYDYMELSQALLAENPAYKIALVDAPLVNISSSQIRGEAQKEKIIF